MVDHPRRATFTFRMTHAEKERWKVAAKDAGLTLAVWVARQCRIALRPMTEAELDACAAERMKVLRALRAREAAHCSMLEERQKRGA